MADFNINNWVSVKLTAEGRAHHRREYDRLAANAGASFVYRPPNEDAQGWSRWQLWHLMEVFGPLCRLGYVLPFDPVIRFDEEVQEPLPSIDPALIPAKGRA